jgi:hypothetical protein
MVSVQITERYQRCLPELNHFKKYMRKKIIRVLQQFWHHHLTALLSKTVHKALPEACRKDGGSTGGPVHTIKVTAARGIPQQNTASGTRNT